MSDDIDMGHQRGATPERSTECPKQPSSRDRIIALCVHERPQQQPHFDLFLAPTGAPFGDDERILETWRLPGHPCELPAGSAMDVLSLGLHRGLYARLEQTRELGGDRGSVTPMARGRCIETTSDAGGRILDINWSDGSRLVLRLEPGRTPTASSQLRRLAHAVFGG